MNPPLDYAAHPKWVVRDMGYWGTLIAARCGSRTPTALHERGGAEPWPEAERGDGWKVFSVDDRMAGDLVVGEELDMLMAITLETSAPVLAAYIADSDYGWMSGSSPAGGAWQAWLGTRSASYFGQSPEKMLRPAMAAKRAVAWAAEAGYRSSERPIRQILATARPPGISALLRLPWKRYTFVEDAYFVLLDHLGVPKPAPPELDQP